MSLRDLVEVSAAWRQARRLERLPDRDALERHQYARLMALLDAVSARSPYYALYRSRPHAEWPVIDKREWMANFDTINTVGARLEPLMRAALDAERSRDFAPRDDGLSVGLSTGTSGARGLFVASRAERNRWAGVVLARLLHEPIWRRQRIALVLRSGNSLYDRIGAGPLTFRYFDLATPWASVVSALHDFAPTILVAPAQVLGLLAAAPDAQRLRPRRVISCAEVLPEFERERLRAAFGVPIEEIYQATEGFLGATCRHGTLHLNEAQYLIEREWLDGAHERFVPIVTDLYRTAQPVIRYRLNDLLSVRPTPCACGSATLALRAIDGRADDVLRLRARDGSTGVSMFPDLLSRTLVAQLGHVVDYEIEELRAGAWRVSTTPTLDAADRSALVTAFGQLAERLGAIPPTVEFATTPATRDLTRKLRRVRRADASA